MTWRTEIFVFGSNTAGRHGKGAALYAKQKHGAVYGVGEGLTGLSYALPTKGEDANKNLYSLRIGEIDNHFRTFVAFATAHPEMLFLLTPIGCGYAGHSRSTMMKMIQKHKIPDNVVFTKEWFKL